MNVLGRLALRALGAPAQVRPRLGGLFESPAAGGGTEVVATPAFAAQIERPAASPFSGFDRPSRSAPASAPEPPPRRAWASAGFWASTTCRRGRPPLARSPPSVRRIGGRAIPARPARHPRP